MKTCIRCGSALIPNPERPHWAHCPACEPKWAEAIIAFIRFSAASSFAHFAANDKRGRPTMGGIRS